MENQGRALRMVMSVLTEEQHEEARQAFDRLGEIYSLDEVVSFFLRHHRPPEFTIRLGEAIDAYLEDRERDGIRERSRKAIRSVLKQFRDAADDPWTHEVTPQTVEKFLRGLRAKDGESMATRKTWNNYRNDLHGFFKWAKTPDVASNRPFTFENPVASVRKFTARQVREEQSGKPTTTDPEKVLRMFTALSRWRSGVMLKHFALLYFAGIRPEELKRMKDREGDLINLATRTITVPADVSKTGHERQIHIADNLAAWLEAAPAPAVPSNLDRLAKRIRKKYDLSHDEARHSFISYHVALHRSIGDAALQAGNSESIVKRHYLNTHTREEGSAFFRIAPGGRGAVLTDAPTQSAATHLKAV
ncbi:tyrosine-type recombinase/integrase [Haloferula sp. A504]|uniref:tyrosine-type recombinase/integrase n=1 Tax=Haloferula sp. A504 TaxID=3373601 RepID=UPI0031C7CCD8|nr:hypothetical protein [Verrucomicrobiaceae bacterium E54]